MPKIRLARAAAQAATAAALYSTVNDQATVTDALGGSLTSPATPPRIRIAGAAVRGTTAARPAEVSARIRIATARVQGTGPANQPTADPLFVVLADTVDIADDRDIQQTDYGDALADTVGIVDQVAAVLTDPQSAIKIRVDGAWMSAVRRVRIGGVWVVLGATTPTTPTNPLTGFGAGPFGASPFGV